ncbi:flagellar hook-basal body complex protein FliE [Robertmurraya yapensis]|uniref:Flagellar hook-basal body complex protein FliE n=2 Tax=Bacillaceae TaxID=186817 RepID=A0A3S0RT06_9BACI|nr:flagellar hook-basal body complex protein FliE [Bacillus yapensis]RTR35575.1 flagellar hook-basal body complex protein FliE [Bacillus yapensis]TKS98376.1 flagellar hook-basal body complex protein FliE [Bacillus yapensis]
MNNISFPNVSKVFQTNQTSQTSSTTPFEAQKSFASVLKESIEKVNQAQLESDVMTEKLARGENVDLHQVMIASQKASVTLSATMEIRNKVVEAYQEVMRMQV